jgi:multiple sugar transport system substrate-binding protein
MSTLLGSGALLAACGGAQTATQAPGPAATTAATSAPSAATSEATSAATTAATEAATTAATSAATEAAPTTAPAAGGGGKVTVLHRQEYFKELENQYKAQTEEFIKSLGYEPDVSTVNPEVFGDFMAKMQAAVSAGNPPDLAYHVNSISQMHDLDLVVDHTDIVNELTQKYGDPVPATVFDNARFENVWYSVPHSSNSGAWFVRSDWAKDASVDPASLKTLQERLDAALKMSDPSKERYGWGLTVNKSGDGHGLITTAFQAFGGTAVDETGNKVTFNSPETVAGIQWLADVYTKPENKKVLPPGVESWTDPSNNEAYLAGKIGMTANAFSIYAKAKADKNPVLGNTAVVRFPLTNDGKLELGGGGNAWYSIFKGAKQTDAARQIILHFLDPKVFSPLSILGGGLVMPAYKNAWTDDLVKADPAFSGLKDIMFNPNAYLGFGHPAKPNAAIDAAFATGFLSQIMSDIISGKKTAEQAVADGHKIMVQIFEEKGLPQK